MSLFKHRHSLCALTQVNNTVVLSEDVLPSFVAQIGMEHWLHDGFKVSEPYTFTFNTYNPILGVQVDEHGVLSKATSGTYVCSNRFKRSGQCR